MNTILQRIGQEWERNLLLLLVTLVAAGGGFLAYEYLHREEEPEPAPKGPPELPRYFDVALLQEQPAPAIADGVNPLACLMDKPPRPPQPARPNFPPKPQPQPPKPQQPQAKPQPPQTKPQQPQAKPQPTTPPKPQPPPKPPKPKRKRRFEFVYMGSMSITGGGSNAVLRVTEILSKNQRNTFRARLDKGGKLFEGLLEISEFDGKRVVLTHSGGKRLFVPMGGKKRVLEIEVDD